MWQRQNQQCDHIGNFFKILCTNFLPQKRQNILQLFGRIVKNGTFKDNLRATLRQNWATYYFNIKSHWKQLIERFMWKERKIGANFPSSLTSSVTRWLDWFLIFGHLKQRNFDTKQVQIDSLKVGSQLGQISNKHLKCCTNISKFLLH